MRSVAAVVIVAVLALTAGCSDDDTPGLDGDLDPTVAAADAPDSYGQLASDVASVVADAVGTQASQVHPESFATDDGVCQYWSASYELPVWFGRDTSWDAVRSAIDDAVPGGWSLGDSLDIPGGYSGFDVTEDATGAVVTVRAKGTSTIRVVAPVEGDCPDGESS